jgi:predicted alpha/beta hydrolase
MAPNFGFFGAGDYTRGWVAMHALKVVSKYCFGRSAVTTGIIAKSSHCRHWVQQNGLHKSTPNKHWRHWGRFDVVKEYYFMIFTFVSLASHHGRTNVALWLH